MLVLLILNCQSYSQVAGEDELPLELAKRYEVLIAELRCPKCLNINIADSNAPIAKDLRVVVQMQLKEGKTNDAIKTFLRDRYGDFIDYNPPLSPGTLILWLLPVVLIICACLVMTYVGKKKVALQITDEELARLKNLKSMRMS